MERKVDMYVTKDDRARWDGKLSSLQSVGDGTSVVASANQIKSMEEGDDISIVSTPTTVQISAAPLSSPGTGASLVTGTRGVKGLVAGTGISISQSTNDIVLSAPRSGTVTVLGQGDLVTDAWGVQKVSRPHTLMHGLWTFDIPQTAWFMYENGSQVYSSTCIVSINGCAKVSADSTVTTARLESRECPRYQPNRGHLFSTALWCPSKLAGGVREWGLGTQENRVNFRLKSDGNLYAVRRSANVEVAEQLINTSALTGFDVQKNNIYDIQMQWRGAGNYNFFIGDPGAGVSVLVHTFNLLGTLTSVSIENPAMPMYFSAQRVTENVELFTACADVTSENGQRDSLQFDSVYRFGAAVNTTNVPVIILHNPLQLQGKTNTRTVTIIRFSVLCSKKATFRVWVTRDATAFSGATFVDGGQGSCLKTDSPDVASGAVSATTVTPAKLRTITSIPVEGAVPGEFNNPSPDKFIFDLVRGDYLVMTCSATSATADVVVEYGEAI